MAARFEPEVGDWYRNEEGALFEVVFVDDVEGSVEVQYQDGAVVAVDVDDWYQMKLSRRAPPRWEGAFEGDEPDDWLGDVSLEARE